MSCSVNSGQREALLLVRRHSRVSRDQVLVGVHWQTARQNNSRWLLSVLVSKVTKWQLFRFHESLWETLENMTRATSGGLNLNQNCNFSSKDPISSKIHRRVKKFRHAP